MNGKEVHEIYSDFLESDTETASEAVRSTYSAIGTALKNTCVPSKRTCSARHFHTVMPKAWRRLKWRWKKQYSKGNQNVLQWGVLFN